MTRAMLFLPPRHALASFRCLYCLGHCSFSCFPCILVSRISSFRNDTKQQDLERLLDERELLRQRWFALSEAARVLDHLCASSPSSSSPSSTSADAMAQHVLKVLHSYRAALAARLGDLPSPSVVASSLPLSSIRLVRPALIDAPVRLALPRTPFQFLHISLLSNR